MKIQDFIMKAVLGGWRPKDNLVVDEHNENTFGQLVLDPEAWKAVGKAKGIPGWNLWALENMHGMISALFDGKTIEQFLETL